MEDKMIEYLFFSLFHIDRDLIWLDFGQDVNLTLIIMEDIESRN